MSAIVDKMKRVVPVGVVVSGVITRDMSVSYFNQAYRLLYMELYGVDDDKAPPRYMQKRQVPYMPESLLLKREMKLQQKLLLI